MKLSHWIDDGEESVRGQRRQREDGDTDGNVLDALGKLAKQRPEGPRVQNVQGERERHARDDHLQRSKTEKESNQRFNYEQVYHFLLTIISIPSWVGPELRKIFIKIHYCVQ